MVPSVLDALDSELFPISEEIVREMIHNRHKHQQESHLGKHKSETIKTEQAKRKHQNSRRNDVSSFVI